MQPFESANKISCEIGINDCAPAIRMTLTKGATQHRIKDETGVVVVTRGTYKPPNSTSGMLFAFCAWCCCHQKKRVRAADIDWCGTIDEAPVHLYLESDSQAKLDRAVSKIRAIMRSAASFAEKIYVGSRPNDNVKPRLLGPRGSYLKHIESRAAVRIHLRGNGSGYIDTSGGMCSSNSARPLYSVVHIANAAADIGNESTEWRCVAIGPTHCRGLQGAAVLSHYRLDTGGARYCKAVGSKLDSTCHWRLKEAANHCPYHCHCIKHCTGGCTIKQQCSNSNATQRTILRRL
jgi:hypothetical protein